uniref:Putative m13 family peptidase n=1 Tax=Amblyomma cajennense TaxID=34607 RepID=A0A023FCX0_AMBCJ
MIFRIISLGILCVTICASKSTRSSLGEKGPSGDVCHEDKCVELVQEIKSQMGNATPCDNFYQNICGKWRGSLELERKPLKEKAVKDLAGLLEEARVEPTPSPNATDKLINAFQSCTQQAKNVLVLRNSVESVLQGYNLGHWPVQNSATAQKINPQRNLRKCRSSAIV